MDGLGRNDADAITPRFLIPVLLVFLFGMLGCQSSQPIHRLKYNDPHVFKSDAYTKCGQHYAIVEQGSDYALVECLRPYSE